MGNAVIIYSLKQRLQGFLRNVYNLPKYRDFKEIASNKCSILLLFKTMKKAISILILLGLLTAIGGAGALYYFKSKWATQSNRSAKEVIITIKRGSGVGSIARVLKKHALIESVLDFKLYSRIQGTSEQYQSGVYAIPGNASIDDVAQQLIKGKTATTKVTIPEGRVSWEIAGILHTKMPHIDSATFEKVVYDAGFARKLGVQSKSLEGYLYPDTYRFPYGADEKEIVSIMVHSFKAIFKSLNPKKSQLYKKYGENGVVTFASVVEEEAGVQNERGRIAGVFYNRLRRGMPLGADPTVRYIFRNLTGPIYKSQLNSNSPFNTRKFKGLMPHAVSNPGKEALRAALFPDTNGYLYFVAKDNGSMEHFFSKSLREHNRYKNVAAVNRQKYGIN